MVLASLYLGTGSLEKELVSFLRSFFRRYAGRLKEFPHLQVEGIRQRVEKNGHDMKVHFVFDALRGSRGHPNSRTMLTPLLQAHPHNVKVSLFHTNLLGGLVKRLVPDRFNESFGLFHMKVYVFDNDVILSG